MRNLLIVDEVFGSGHCIWGSGDGNGPVWFVTGTTDPNLSLGEVSDLADFDAVLSNDTSNKLKCVSV